jgi:hypothetical protein
LRKSQWSKRYDERNHESAHVGQALEEGEEGDNYVPEVAVDRERLRNEGLWTGNDEEYYNEGEFECGRGSEGADFRYCTKPETLALPCQFRRCCR